MGIEECLDQQLETLFTTDIKEPEQYRVILLNDDYTTKDFVVFILMGIFHKKEQEAILIMEDVHKKGKGFVGAYTYDIAATRCAHVHQLAQQDGFPLKCVMEKL